MLSPADPLSGMDALITLLDALQREGEGIVVEIREQLRQRFPTYEAMATDEVDHDIQVSLSCALSRSRPDGHASPESDAVQAMAQVGARAAEHGVPVDDLLGVWRIGLQVVVRCGRREAERLGLGDGVALDLAEAVLQWSDVAMGASALAHRQAELETLRRDQKRRSAFVIGVLTGTLGSAEVRRQASTHGVELHREYMAVRARPASGVGSWELERELGFHAATPYRPGLDAELGEDIVGFLTEIPDEVSKGLVGVGPARTPERLAESYRLATRALTTAEGFGLTGIHTLDSLGVRPAIVADRDVAEALHARYLAPVLATGSGRELLVSVLAYFDRGMHVERAAEQLHVHPNTLRYRLARFEELTSTNLRDMNAALEIWWALQAHAALAHLPASE